MCWLSAAVVQAVERNQVTWAALAEVALAEWWKLHCSLALGRTQLLLEQVPAV